MLTRIFLYTILFCICQGCQSQETRKEGQQMQINTKHLESLFDLVTVDSHQNVGIVYIYSEYPDYQWIGDSDEGVACVDDAARACIFYLRNYYYTKDEESKRKAISLLRFVLAMQAESGYFYNFIFSDHSINRTGITSLAEPNWWSWRAYWVLAEAAIILDASHPLQDKILASKEKLLQRTKEDFLHKAQEYRLIEGLEIPQWLPGESAADQAALLLMGLTISGDHLTDAGADLVQRMQEGILDMQMDSDDILNGVFLSWENIWHAYGNSQAYALLIHALISQDANSKKHALKEIDNFYSKWMENDGMSNFKVKRIDDSLEIYDRNQYPQIAYDLRPMIWACLMAGEITGDAKYQEKAEMLVNWFRGDNPTGEKMYDANTGRGYDGISAKDKRNLNAGAESTIEALLVLQELRFMNASIKLPWLKSN